MSVAKTRKIVRHYLEGHTVDTLAEDAVFTMMGSGQKFRGRKSIATMLEHFYHGTFEAQPVVRQLLVGDGWAVLEGEVVGVLRKPLGNLEPSDKVVKVPLCVAYEVSDDHVLAARIYLDTNQQRFR